MLRPSIALSLLVMGAAHAPAPARADGGQVTLIHACVKKANGTLRIVSPTGRCKNTETAVHWPAATPQAFVGLGLSTTNPGQRLHIGDGNLLLEGGGETALFFKRDQTFTGGPSGTSMNPVFELGRIQGAGDGDPELRILYEDDDIKAACPRPECAHSVLKVDRKGIVASVKPERGSHFEGFLEPGVDGVPLPGDPEPLFRLNSFPSMQLEMGPGGNQLTDVIIRREAANTVTVLTGNAATGLTERLRIGPDGVRVVVSYLQLSTVLGEPPASDCEASNHAGRVIVRTDGPPDLYVCAGAEGWIGK